MAVSLDRYKKRNSTVELLRLLFMFGIVLDHAYGHGSGLDYEWIFSLGYEWRTAFHLAFFSVGCIGVTGFVFLSGYYGLNLNIKKQLELLLMLVFYTLLIGVLKGYSFLAIFTSLLHPWDGWWFIKCYFFICIISPFLNYGINYLTKKQFQFIIIALLIYTYFGHFLSLYNSRDVDFFLSVYLVARYVKKYPPHSLGIYILNTC